MHVTINMTPENHLSLAGMLISLNVFKFKLFQLLVLLSGWLFWGLEVTKLHILKKKIS